MSLGGPPPSTLADVLRYVVKLWAKVAELGPGGLYTTGHTYAVGDIVSSNAAPYVCWAAGTATGPGPSGVGSSRDANGVGWRPLIYTGERFDQQEGAPPRLYFRPDPDEKIGPVLDIGGREIASRMQSCDVFVWGAETTADLDRYDAADALLDQAIAAVFTAGAGRITMGDVKRQDETSIDTFGEEYRWRFEYARLVPRSDAFEAAAAALALLSKSPEDPDRPNGGNGLTPVVAVVSANARPS